MVERAPRQDIASADLDITDVAVRSVCRIGRYFGQLSADHTVTQYDRLFSS